MLCSVYKSRKRDETYLYVEKRDDFSRVPTLLMETFGTPEHVLTTELSPQRKLAAADSAKVIQDLRNNGFYLQVPQQEESMLAVHKAMQQADAELAQMNSADGVCSQARG